MKTLNFKKTILTAAVALSLISCRDDVAPPPPPDPTNTKITLVKFDGENVNPSANSNNIFRAEYDGDVLRRLVGLDNLNQNLINYTRVEFQYNPNNGKIMEKEYFVNFGNAYQESSIQTFLYDSQNRLQVETVAIKPIYGQNYPALVHHKLEYFYAPNGKILKIAVTEPITPISGQFEITRDIYFTYNGNNISKIDAIAYNGKKYEYTVDPSRTISHDFLPDLYHFDLEMSVENIFRMPLYNNTNVVTSVKVTNVMANGFPLTSSSNLIYINNSLNQNLLSKVLMFTDLGSYTSPYLEFQYNQ